MPFVVAGAAFSDAVPAGATCTQTRFEKTGQMHNFRPIFDAVRKLQTTADIRGDYYIRVAVADGIKKRYA